MDSIKLINKIFPALEQAITNKDPKQIRKISKLLEQVAMIIEQMAAAKTNLPTIEF